MGVCRLLMTIVAICSSVPEPSTPFVVTPEQFGAQGDGKADDTSAFQPAAQAIQQAGEGVLILKSQAIYRAGRQQHLVGETPYWQPEPVIRLDGDTAIVALPHEVFTELGLAIKSGSPFRTTIVMSLANDLDFYIPTRRAFEEGHYEPTTCPLVPGCGERLVEAAVKLLQDLKGPSDDSASAAAPQAPGQR